MSKFKAARKPVVDDNHRVDNPDHFEINQFGECRLFGLNTYKF